MARSIHHGEGRPFVGSFGGAGNDVAMTTTDFTTVAVDTETADQLDELRAEWWAGVTLSKRKIIAILAHNADPEKGAPSGATVDA